MTIHDRVRQAPNQAEREYWLEILHWRQGFTMGLFIATLFWLAVMSIAAWLA